MRRYLLSPIAEQDIDDIISYIAQDNPAAAMKMLDSFFTAMDMLAEHPQMGHEIAGDTVIRTVEKNIHVLPLDFFAFRQAAYGASLRLVGDGRHDKLNCFRGFYGRIGAAEAARVGSSEATTLVDPRVPLPPEGEESSTFWSAAVSSNFQ